jgi:hypothetical protein
MATFTAPNGRYEQIWRVWTGVLAYRLRPGWGGWLLGHGLDVRRRAARTARTTVRKAIHEAKEVSSVMTAIA